MGQRVCAGKYTVWHFTEFIICDCVKCYCVSDRREPDIYISSSYNVLVLALASVSFSSAGPHIYAELQVCYTSWTNRQNPSLFYWFLQV